MLRRFFSAVHLKSPRYVHTKEQIAHAKSWMETFQAEQIPRHDFSISYSRSSGPGGQKVNKTSSKATVSLEPFQWLNPKICWWIPGPVREQISVQNFRYQTKSGGLLIQSDLSRNREVNTEECFRKLLGELKQVVYFEEEASEEDKKKWQKISEQQKEYRLKEKKRNSEKKKARSKKFDL